MAKEGLTVSGNIQLTAREIDFATRFPRDWTALQQIMGISRPIERVPGTKLTSKYAVIKNLADGHVAEGEEVPYSEAEIKEREYTSLEIERHALAVTLKAISDHGYDAVALADQELRYSLVSMIMGRYYDYIKGGTLTARETNFQMGLAMAKGRIVNRWKEMHRGITNVVGFCNVLDVYEYLGAANINNVEREFGVEYLKNFMGFSPLFMLSDSEIPRGMIVATPVENIGIYYIPPSAEDFRKAGFDYTTDTTGGMNMIGVHIEVNYDTAVSVMHTLFGISMFSEYLDGIAVITFGDAQSGGTGGAQSGDAQQAEATLGVLTVTSAAGTQSGDTAITVSPEKASGNVYKIKVADSATDVTVGQNVQNWTAWDGSADITAETGKTITVVEADSAYKAVKAGSATVTAKE